MEKKRHDAGAADGTMSGGLVEKLPQTLIVDILSRLDLYSLCSASPVCCSLEASVSEAISSISSLDLSGFPPSIQILNRILNGNNVFECLILDCSRLIDSSLDDFAKEHLVNLTLLKCSSFSSSIFIIIGERCPNLRHFALDMATNSNKKETTIPYNKAIIQMLHSCSQLESLALKFQVQHPGGTYFNSIWHALPKSIKVLLLQPISNKQARIIPTSQNSFNNPPNYINLNSLTLVLDIISDELILSLSTNLPNLTQLNLEDNPTNQPNLDEDLTNNGLHLLSFCHKLNRLYLTRGKQSTFQRVNDIGIFLLSEGCKKLESVRLGGFSKVTDAGYASIIHSCKNLRKIDIINAHFLSDLAFLDLVNSNSSIVEVRLVSCNLLTSETAISLSSCKKLEILDLSSCRSIADTGLISISKLHNLTVLDLAGSDITDIGLYSLACTNSPIFSLTLRNCKRITDNGISQLFLNNTILSSTLTTLDLGYIPRLTDRVIMVISERCKKLTNLSLRGCFSITNNAVVTLGAIDRVINGGSVTRLRMLDLYLCSGLLNDALRLFDKPYYRGLRWLGIGGTRLVPRGNGRVLELVNERSGLMICKDGCEMGCKNDWPYHS